MKQRNSKGITSQKTTNLSGHVGQKWTANGTTQLVMSSNPFFLVSTILSHMAWSENIWEVNPSQKDPKFNWLLIP
jgi:hypothetical protein